MKCVIGKIRTCLIFLSLNRIFVAEKTKKMRKNIITVVLTTISTLPFVGCSNDNLGDAVEQTSIERIEQMPKIPQPYKIIDFRQKAIDYDAYVFDENTRVMGSPLIWYDNARRNINQETFGLYTAVNDSRQGPDQHGGDMDRVMPAASDNGTQP